MYASGSGKMFVCGEDGHLNGHATMWFWLHLSRVMQSLFGKVRMLEN